MSSALITISDVGMGAGGFATFCALVAAFFRKRIGVWLTGKMSAFVQPLLADLERNLTDVLGGHAEELKHTKELLWAVDTKVVKANATLHPNGGSSIADRVQRIEIGLAEVAKDVKHLQEAK